MYIKGYNVDKYNKRVIYTLRSLFGFVGSRLKNVPFSSEFSSSKVCKPKNLDSS